MSSFTKSSRRLDNVSVAAEAPGGSPHTCVGGSTICEPLSDRAWVQGKYNNFRAYVRSLVVQEPKLEEWHLWLDTIPLAIFLAGGDGELRGVREASTDEQRSAAAGLVLERFAAQWDFDLDRICESDRKKLRLYIHLFSEC
jgi:hypothetical protein